MNHKSSHEAVDEAVENSAPSACGDVSAAASLDDDESEGECRMLLAVRESANSTSVAAGTASRRATFQPAFRRRPAAAGRLISGKSASIRNTHPNTKWPEG